MPALQPARSLDAYKPEMHSTVVKACKPSLVMDTGTLLFKSQCFQAWMAFAAFFPMPSSGSSSKRTKWWQSLGVSQRSWTLFVTQVRWKVTVE